MPDSQKYDKSTEKPQHSIYTTYKKFTDFLFYLRDV